MTVLLALALCIGALQSKQLCTNTTDLLFLFASFQRNQIKIQAPEWTQIITAVGVFQITLLNKLIVSMDLQVKEKRQQQNLAIANGAYMRKRFN